MNNFLKNNGVFQEERGKASKEESEIFNSICQIANNEEVDSSLIYSLNKVGLILFTEKGKESTKFLKEFEFIIENFVDFESGEFKIIGLNEDFNLKQDLPNLLLNCARLCITNNIKNWDPNKIKTNFPISYFEFMEHLQKTGLLDDVYEVPKKVNLKGWEWDF